MEPFRLRKAANAFIAGARPSDLVPLAAHRTSTRLQKRDGGLWVGGVVEATETYVEFAANSINAALHHGLDHTFIRTSSIRSVRREFGWVTGIVVIAHADGQFRFRCLGAKRLAKLLASRYGAS